MMNKFVFAETCERGKQEMMSMGRWLNESLQAAEVLIWPKYEYEAMRGRRC